ncbi:response regulator transcription factor [Lysobacter sp. LF1]|uniref:Response regulator transcription factor n=1 Tax=Lysobacter stagni TaxID=3045172 RepID=A0ABT6XJ63_9GAMM|nr:response regulator transcription factor [Lysobacter sp. LF1]MDI9239810.1 response regulator transcription factor [Lysobacter sp. LF1]
MAFRIVLADDHPIVSRGVRMLLEQASGLRVVAEVASPDELMTVLAATPCDLLVTDFNMPGEQADGLNLLQLLGRRWPELPVVVLTQLGNPGTLGNISRLSNVRGVVSKADAVKELHVAINAAVANRNYVSASVKRQLDLSGADASDATAALSKREAEVMRLFASGHTVSEIARQLNRSVKTVSSQKVEAMRKLGVTSDLELYSYAREHGLTF